MIGKSKRVDLEQVDKEKTRRKIEDWLRKVATTENLVEIADRYGIEVAFLPEGQRHCSCCERGKPCSGDPAQVRCIHQVREGQTYYEVDGESRQRFVVVKGPHKEYLDLRIVTVKYIDRPLGGLGGIEIDTDLEKYNLVRGDYGWDDSNRYLAFAEGDFCPDCHHHCHQCHPHC